MKKRRHPSGFTLVELLVSIAIIAILAVIIFPVASRMTDSALGTKCISNLRQIGVAVNQYASENNGNYPKPLSHGSIPTFVPVRYYVDGNSVSGSAQPNKALDPYLSDLAVTMCPVVVKRKILGPTELQYWFGTSTFSEKRYLQAGQQIDPNDCYPALAWCTWPAYDYLKSKGGAPHFNGQAMNVLRVDGSVSTVNHKQWRNGGFP